MHSAKLFLTLGQECADEVLGFVSIESGAPDEFLQLFLVRPSQSLGVWKTLEEGRSDHVHPHIGALGR